MPQPVKLKPLLDPGFDDPADDGDVRPDYDLDDLAEFWPDLTRGQRESIHNIVESNATMNRLRHRTPGG
ncbi:MAG: hypothetical protein HQ512_04675 [Rhodospirillales bacterium]|nr:hypothetical protein [Rhodospirillales bacterium]